MGLLDIFKKDGKEQAATMSPEQGKRAVETKEKGKLLKKGSASVKASQKSEKKGLVKSTKKDTKNAYKVLIKPIVTEKATMTGTYLFMVNAKTNKQEIKKAIKAVYGVTPKRINVMNFEGRKVKWGRSSGTTKSWKKAIVYLQPGDKIEIYEGV